MEPETKYNLHSKLLLLFSSSKQDSRKESPYSNLEKWRWKKALLFCVFSAWCCVNCIETRGILSSNRTLACYKKVVDNLDNECLDIKWISISVSLPQQARDLHSVLVWCVLKLGNRHTLCRRFGKGLACVGPSGRQNLPTIEVHQPTAGITCVIILWGKIRNGHLCNQM